MSRKIFVNLGAGSGSDIEGFINLSLDNKQFEIFAFECNPNLIANLKTTYPSVNVMEFAAFDVGGPAKLYFGDLYINSSLHVEKCNVYADKYVNVQTIDITKWLLDNFTKNDYIILTMDIEGAEFEVLERMFQLNAFNIIDEFYVEFHGRKISENAKLLEKKWVSYLIDKFKDQVYIYEHHHHKQFMKLNRDPT